MDEARPTGVVAAELMQQIEEAAVSAAREILSGRRIIDVEGPYGVGLTTVEVGNDDRCREPGPEGLSDRGREHAGVVAPEDLADV